MIPEFVTIYDLVHGLNEADILAACAATDPENANGYASVLAELKTLEPKRGTLTVEIRWLRDEAEFDVGGRYLGDDNSYGIEFSPWEEWLGATFAVKDADLTPAQILAEILNEMTCGGWSQIDREERLETLHAALADIQDLIYN